MGIFDVAGIDAWSDGAVGVTAVGESAAEAAVAADLLGGGGVCDLRGGEVLPGGHRVGGEEGIAADTRLCVFVLCDFEQSTRTGAYPNHFADAGVPCDGDFGIRDLPVGGEDG